MLLTHETSLDFLNQTRTHPHCVKSACVRNASIGFASRLRMGVEDITLFSSSALTSSLLSSLPILGTIRGLARLYSVWSVKDRRNDHFKDQGDTYPFGNFRSVRIRSSSSSCENRYHSFDIPFLLYLYVIWHALRTRKHKS